MIETETVWLMGGRVGVRKRVRIYGQAHTGVDEDGVFIGSDRTSFDDLMALPVGHHVLQSEVWPGKIVSCVAVVGNVTNG